MGISSSGMSLSRFIFSISLDDWRVTLGGRGGNILFSLVGNDKMGGSFFFFLTDFFSLSKRG